jgi:hypothetical protein
MMYGAQMVATRTVATTDQVKGVLKAELKRRNLTYADLAQLLAARGVVESEANLRNKISRGSFTAAFLFECLIAMGCEQVQLSGRPIGLAPPGKTPAA